MKYVTSCISPVGRLYLEASQMGLQRITLATGIVEDQPNALLIEVVAQLQAYFKGALKSFDVEIDFQEASPFQQKVWTALTQIPYGKTISYLDLALIVGTEKHTRAVGLANGKNPIPIIVPCHRVIGSDGSLTGYALGLAMKRYLLNHENPGAFAIQTSLF
ncbi:MAG: methylated-DNA--[protein]-cysteine S-methyltransferase [Saprospiraceae bacterium]|nr:methylated-DNA--[protein]-cysteine S-methyltransferase [Saprospiraceae bacterium]